MNNQPAYITEIQNKPDNSLREYVNIINTKLDYAKWKQNLVLSYNYMPLANIQQKLHNDRIAYVKKMESEEARLRALVDNQEIITLLRNLGQFKVRLTQTAEKYEKKIKQQKIIVFGLKAKAHECRQKLKNIKRSNTEQFMLKLQQRGINTARDIKSLTRSKSTVSNLTSRTTRLSHISRPSLVNLQPPMKIIPQKSSKIQQLYASCVASLLNQHRKQNQQSILTKRESSNSFLNMKNYVSMPSAHREQKQTMQLKQFMKINSKQIVDLIYKQNSNDQILETLLRAS